MLAGILSLTLLVVVIQRNSRLRRLQRRVEMLEQGPGREAATVQPASTPAELPAVVERVQERWAEAPVEAPAQLPAEPADEPAEQAEPEPAEEIEPQPERARLTF